MWHRQRARNRTDVNHAAAIGTEVLSGLLSRQNKSQDIRVEHAVKLLLGNLLEGGKLIYARIVHQHIQTSKGFLGLGKDALHVFGFCYISLHRDGLATLGFNFRDNPLRAFFAGGVIDDYGGTFCRQTPGDARADALRRAGHYCHLVRKLTHGFSPFDLLFVRSAFARHFDDRLIDDRESEKDSNRKKVRFRRGGSSRPAAHPVSTSDSRTFPRGASRLVLPSLTL